MNLLEGWKEKNRSGQIRFDADLTVMSRGHAPEGSWGTVYYSQARERYKREVAAKPATTFDLDLMERVRIGDFGGLVIAANPNSLVEGHLVIYPREKSPELTLDDLVDMTRLAHDNPHFTFIHNAERSAASIIDWAHFQAYPWHFALFDSPVTQIDEADAITLSIVDDSYPAYAACASTGTVEILGQFLFAIGEALRSNANPTGRRVPVNYIWRGEKVWIVPRARAQSERASRYFGGLEIGGIFCLPSSADFPTYVPAVLKEEIGLATLRCPEETETREWFERTIKDILNNAR